MEDSENFRKRMTTWMNVMGAFLEVLLAGNSRLGGGEKA